MSSSGGGGGQQFRYAQAPSKVLHLRNLPWECAEEELVELCKPFGCIVSTKCGVGANRNQAFVEFTDINQAISMVSYFASSSEPAQIRGKSVYIQYSNRQEIVNNRSPGETAGNVLLVTIEGVQASDVTIDVIHMAHVNTEKLSFQHLQLERYHVFSTFGYVHKIATFEKAAGFQALIQYTDEVTASAAREALDGRSIPSYLLPEHVTSCCLRISFSAHKDLNIKFQSNRSRDYNNPYLPINYSAMDGSTLQPAIGADGRKVEAEGNVLLASIENMQYVVTVDVLHTVFSSFGTVQKIAIFEKNGATQALIQYPDVTTAAVAKEALEGHCIYDGGYCKLHLSYSRHTDLNVKAQSDKSRDYTIPAGVIQAIPQPPGVSATYSGWQGNPHAASPYAPPGVVAQGHNTNRQVQNWNQGNSGFPPVPGAYPCQMYSSPVQYTSSGGFPTPPAPRHELQASQQMPPPYHGNQQLGPTGAPGMGQPPPPPPYYR
ncbi:polypyrimidine tract-binding protein homolog 1-like isoform X2 [Phragmites australis]|uniref:polypyrimidine tract-binding protein homolog 1-like isoform X2 n=1 Tax=Phragmites australis TaxID=29695 RepID=UPI002D77B46F|nr:polypyrimidine tract-binding protein homolog 1-like isoform X2 [Phragmites australis]